jgi:hypothetical protein
MRLRRALATLGLAAALAASCSAGAKTAAHPSNVVLAGLDGDSVRPFESRARASVFVFSRVDCPVAARYAPYLERLQHRLGADRIDFALVFVDPSQSADAIRAYLRDYGFTGRALRDSDHALVRLVGATTTPEAAVFVHGTSGPALVYRGRIDDQYMDIGRTRPAATLHDLDDVIEDVRAGRPVAFHSTPAVGCLIADVTR